LTANWTAQGGIKAQKLIGKAGFIHLDEDELSKKLSELGHRFPKARASYIIKNRKIIGQLKQLTTIDPFEAREWLVNNAIGIGYKEASHFLRNTGVEKLAILDRHVLSRAGYSRPGWQDFPLGHFLCLPNFVCFV